MNDSQRPLALALAVVVLSVGVVLVLGAKARGDVDARLHAALAEAERELVEKQEIAQQLNERRRELDALEERLAAQVGGQNLDEPPLRPIDAKAQPPPPAARAPLDVPPPAWWEGSDADRTRRLLSDTRRRIVELEKVIGEVNNIQKRKAEMEAKLAPVERLRARQSAPDGGVDR